MPDRDREAIALLREAYERGVAAERKRIRAAVEEADMVNELALVIAKARTGASVYMDGSHNPRPSERIAAERFVAAVLRIIDGEKENE